MKKGIYAILAGIIFSIALTGLASAYYYYPDVSSISQSVIDSYVNVFEPVLNALFGGYGWSGLYLFERLLLFILLVSIIYVSVDRFTFFENQKTVKWIISVVVPLIGMRFMDYDWLNQIFLQYQVVTIVMGSIVPFLIYFFFLHSIGRDYPMIRKAGWIFFMGIYAGLWSTSSSGAQGAIFFWTMIAALLFLLFDKRIEIYFTAQEFAKRERWRIDDEVGKLNHQINQISEQIRNGEYLDAREGRRHIKDLQIHRDALIRNRLRV